MRNSSEQHKVITFGIPSYNAEKDLDRCVLSILEGSSFAPDIEVVIVDDGSSAEGEHYLQLSQTERDMVDMVCSNFNNVIVIYNGDRKSTRLNSSH